MIGKNEEEDNNDNNLYRIKLIANKRKSLEDDTAQVSDLWLQFTPVIRILLAIKNINFRIVDSRKD